MKDKSTTIDGVILTPLEIIKVAGGNVLHGMKETDPGYTSFGEAYFSTIDLNVVKAWKRHREMTLNLIVPIGTIRFVIYDNRKISSSYDKFYSVTLSRDNYSRLTVPPMVWMGFQGLGKINNMLLNIADIEHFPEESDRKEINEIKYDWELSK